MDKNKPLVDCGYAGLRKIISGGQCGVDRGGLDAAKGWPIEVGGTAPKGYRTQFGPDLSLKNYGLVESHSSDYPPRTEQNVIDSDGTLLLGQNLTSPGSALTSRLAKKHGRPILSVQYPVHVHDEQRLVTEIAAWITRNAIEVLNVAGNRDMQGDYHRRTTEALVTSVLLELSSQDRLVKLSI